MENKNAKLLNQTEMDKLFCTDKETLSKMLEEEIEELGYNPCVFNASGATVQIKVSYKEIL